MQYTFIIIFIAFVGFAIYRQKSLKKGFEEVDFNFYGDEALEITKTITKDQLSYVSCGASLDTLTDTSLKAYTRSAVTQSTTNNFKYHDYYVVAKTATHIYFIPSKIVGNMKLTLKQNPNKKTKRYILEKVKEEIVASKPNNAIPSIDVTFSINAETDISIQFYNQFEAYK